MTWPRRNNSDPARILSPKNTHILRRTRHTQHGKGGPGRRLRPKEEKTGQNGLRSKDLAAARSPASSELRLGSPRLQRNKLQSPGRKTNNPNVGKKRRVRRKKNPFSAVRSAGLSNRSGGQTLPAGKCEKKREMRAKRRRAALRIFALQFCPRLSEWRSCTAENVKKGDASRGSNSGISTPQIQTLPRRVCAQPAASDRYEGLEQN